MVAFALAVKFPPAAISTALAPEAVVESWADKSMFPIKEVIVMVPCSVEMLGVMDVPDKETLPFPVSEMIPLPWAMMVSRVRLRVPGRDALPEAKSPRLTFGLSLISVSMSVIWGA